MAEQDMLISKDTENKRLEDFKKVAENWDSLPEYAKGKMDGMISAVAAIYLEDKK